MEKNYNSAEDLAVFEPAPSMPHFDEDATLLSARPVVPLDEVTPKKRFPRLLVFGLTIVAAILVGAISATMLLIENTQNSQSATEVETSQPIAPSAAASGGSTSDSADTRLSEQALEKAPPAKQISLARDSSIGSIKKRQNTVVLRNVVKPDRTRTPARDNDRVYEDDEWELRRAERIESRREARRERRRRRVQNSDDLLRVREIFEGSPRP